MRDRIIGSLVALAAVLAFSSVTRAQTADVAGAAKTHAAAQARDLSGVWTAERGGEPYALLTSTNDEPPMTPWGKAQLKEAKSGYQKIPIDEAANNDPHLRCDPAGVPRSYLLSGPIEFIQTPKRVFIFYETDHKWRDIWMDGRALPKNPDPTYMGYSVGKWEGDTLVIDTIGFNDKTWLDNVGHPHSDGLQVVERIKRVDHDTLQVTFTIEDTKAYTKSWTTAPRIFKLKPSWEIKESFCVPDDNFLFDKTVRLPRAPRK